MLSDCPLRLQTEAVSSEDNLWNVARFQRVIQLVNEGRTTERMRACQRVVSPEMTGWGAGRRRNAEQKHQGWTWQQDMWQRPMMGTAVRESKLTYKGDRNRVTRASVFMCPGLCGTFCFMCLACQVAADMNECCLCGTSVAMRTLYRTRYGIPVSLLQHCIIQTCPHIQNHHYKPAGHLMVSIT